MGREPGPAATKHLLPHLADSEAARTIFLMVSDTFLYPTSADSFKILRSKVVIMCATLVCDFRAIVNENRYWGSPILFLTRILFTFRKKLGFFVLSV